MFLNRSSKCSLPDDLRLAPHFSGLPSRSSCREGYRHAEVDFGLAALFALTPRGVRIGASVVVSAAEPLPRFTEEREAAALHFVNKQGLELVPLLDDLKKANRNVYELLNSRNVSGHGTARRSARRPETLRVGIESLEGGEQGVCAGGEDRHSQGRRPEADRGSTADAGEASWWNWMCKRWSTALKCRAELLASKDELTKLRENFDRTVKERFEMLIEKTKKKKPLMC